MISHLYDALGQDRSRLERLGWFREVAANTLQEGPGIIERIANRSCLAKIKRQRSFNHDAISSRRHASVREQTDAQKGPVMQWIGGPVALRRRLDHSEATPATLGTTSTEFVTD